MCVDKVIHLSVSLGCTPHEAFKFFTVNGHLEKWLTEMADVEPKIGGKFEIFWNPNDKENDSTIGCKILAIAPSKFICFEWKGPTQFKHVMNDVRPLTSVVAFFIPNPEGTEVHLLHTGWRDTAESEEARQWFVQAWSKALTDLQKHVSGAE